MSAGLHSAREELGLPNVAPHGGTSFHGLGSSAGQQHHQHQQQQHDHHQHQQHDGAGNNGMHSSHALQKPLALSPRTFGMDDLRDFCGPLGSFKTGLTPRVFSTGLTPRSGFTPRFSTGFTPRINIMNQQTQQQPTSNDTNAFFSRNTGFSPRASDAPQSQKISPTGFTPKDVSGMKVPMRFPNVFHTGSSSSSSGSPQKMHIGHQPMHHNSHTQQMHHQQPPQYAHHASHHHDSMQNELAMGMGMYDYVGRPTIHQPMPSSHMQQHEFRTLSSSKTSPVSDKGSEQDDLDERRRMKNRERVRKCRKRKQDRLNFLEDRTSELEKENHQLKTKIARKSAVGSGTSSIDALTEPQLQELRTQQTAAIAAYIRAYNEADTGAFDTTARAVWSEHAEVVYGNAGSSVVGVDAIVANQRASTAVFAMYSIKQSTVQWKPTATDKCAVHWDVDVALRADAPRSVPLTAPFANLSRHFGPTDVLSFRMTSLLTFNDDGLIAEEMRQLNLSPIADAALAKFADDPKLAADVLRCLLVAA